MDAAARQVGDRIARAYEAILGDRLVAVAAHGSAVTGYIPGFSDFDFVLVVHGFPSVADAGLLNRRLTIEAPTAEPFTYFQMSAVVDVDDPQRRQHGLIPGGFQILAGELPPGWAFNSADELRESGRQWLGELPRLLRADTIDWAADVAERRVHRLRVVMTRIKPALRALLVGQGAEPVEMWLADWHTLARHYGALDSATGREMQELLAMLPASGDLALAAGNMALNILERLTVAAAGPPSVTMDPT